MKGAVILVLAGVLVPAGCSWNNVKTAAVQSRAGTMKIGNDVVNAASLGVPVYGGATQDEGAVSMAGLRGPAQMAAYTTADPFEKVYEFYKHKLPSGSEKMKLDEGESSVAEFITGSERPGAMQTLVMISKKGRKTSIIITKSANAK